MPERIEREISNLSQRIVLEEVFDALTSPLNAYLRNAKDKDVPAIDLSGLIKRIESAQQALYDCPPVNHAVLMIWLISQAREKRLLSKIRGNR